MRVGGRWTLRFCFLVALLMMLGCGVQTLWEWEADAYVAPGRLVDVGGRRMHIVCEGEGSPTVVMDAGGTHDSMQYAEIARNLAARARACAYDRAAMGWSDPTDAPRSAKALVDDLRFLLSRAEIGPPYVLVGSSAGGMTVELFVREHPSEVVGLVLLDALSGSMVEGFEDEAERLRSRACFGRFLNRFGLLRILDPLQRAGDGEPALTLTYRNATWDAICSLTENFPSSAEQLRSAPPLPADMPIAVIARDSSKMPGDAFEQAWRRAQAASAARSSRGRLVVAAGSGHHITKDRPDLVVESIARMLQ